MAEEKKVEHPILENFAIITTPDNIQKYILGTKKNGAPRAVYDIVKDYTVPKKKKHKKHKKHKNDKGATNTYSFYVDAKKHKKKKKHKKHGKGKHWHI